MFIFHSHKKDRIIIVTVASGEIAIIFIVVIIFIMVFHEVLFFASLTLPLKTGNLHPIMTQLINFLEWSILIENVGNI